MRKFYAANLKIHIFLFFLINVFLGLISDMTAYGQSSQTFYNNGTFVIPEGVTSIIVEAWGAGGGGSTITNSGARGGGGGGGAYAKSVITNVTPGNTYNVVVGKGGGANSSGGNSTFNSNTVVAAGGGGAANNSNVGGIGGTVLNSTGDTRNAGGNGANGGTTNSGGGGGGAGSGGTGGSASGSTPGAGRTINGGDGGAGVNGSKDGLPGNNYGGGGSGAVTNNTTDRNGGTGANGLAVVSWVPAYLAQLVSINTGAASWCAGETRNVSVTIKNIGQATWISGGAIPINFSYWWSNQGQDSNPRQFPFASLAPGSTQTILVPVTATTAGTFILNFDLVYEGRSWFRDNNVPVGPGNTLFTSPSITINALPNITTQPSTGTQTICQNQAASILSIVANGDGLTYQWYRNTIPSNSGGALIAGATSLTYIPSTTTAGTFYYYCVVTGTCSPVATSAVSGAVIVNATPTANAGNPLSAICQGGTSAALGGSIGGSVTGGAWSDGGIGGTFNPNATTLNAIWIPPANYSGTATLTITTIGGNPCTAASSSKNIIVNPLPTANAGSPLTAICKGSSSVPLGGSFGGSATGGTWSDGGIGGTFNPNATTLNATWTPPAGYSGTATLTLTTSGGTCGTATSTKTQVVNPLPTGALTASSNTVCIGTEVTFTAPNLFANYDFKLNGTSVISSSLNTYKTSTLTNGIPVIVDVIDVNGCAGTLGPVSVTVNPLPTGTLEAFEASGIAPNDGVICAGANVDFSADAGFKNYKFFVTGTGAVLQNGASRTYSTTSLTNGASISVEVTNSSNCVGIFGPRVITVNPVPTGSFIADKSVICAGDNVKFTAPSGYSGYQFYIDGVPAQNSSSNIFNTTTLTNGANVTVIVSNSFSCSTTFGPVSITVNDLPSGNLTADKTTICAGDNVKFTATPGYDNYQFLVNGSPVQTGNSNVYNSLATLVNNATVTVQVTKSSTGCMATFAPVSITVNALPVVTFKAQESSGKSSNDNEICTGASVVFTATGGTQYEFFKDGVSVQAKSTNATYNIPALNATATFKVVVTNSNGCITTSSPVTIIVQPYTALTPITGADKVCVGNKITLANPTQAGTWVWSSDDFNIASVNSVTGEVTGISPGAININYSLINSNGCVTAVSKVITVNALPIISLSGPNPICVDPNKINHYTTQTGQTGYIWSVVGGTINSGGGSADAFVDVIWTSAGTKTINVNYTNSSGCSATRSASFDNAPNTSPTLSGPTTICLNSGGNIYSTEAGQFDYTWTITGGTITTGGGSNNNTATVTWNTSGPQSIAINYSNEFGCNAATSTVYPVTVNTLPTGVISGTTSVCQNSSNPPIMFRGNNGRPPYTFFYNINGSGSYSVKTTAGNTISVSVPTITPGVYNYNLLSVTDANGCSQLQTGTATVTVTALPNASISYVGTPFCTTSGIIGVSRTGTAGGTYTSSPGLTIDPATGAITPATSTAGTYTVTYTVAPFGGCAVYTTTTNVVITQMPSATIAYNNGGSFCKTSVSEAVIITGTTGGTFSAPVGLTINTTTGVINPSTSTAGTYTVTYTIAAAGNCGIFTKTTSVTITNAPTANAGASWETCSSTASLNITTGANTTNSASVLWTSNGTGTFSNGNSITAATYTPSAADKAAGSVILTLTANGNGACAAVSSSKILTITPAPIVVAGPDLQTCANSGAVNITGGASVVNGKTFTWTSSGTGTFTNINSLTLATYNPSAADITGGSVTLTLTATGNGSCTAVTGTRKLIINAIPADIIITPVSATVCQNDILPLSSGSAPITTSQTFTSGTIPLSSGTIPDQSTLGVANSILVAGIPTGAIINSVSVNFNIIHSKNTDLVINLKAPNLNVLNLVNLRGGGNTTGFANTTISSSGSTTLSATGNPNNNTYLPLGTNNVSGATTVPGNKSNVTTFPGLYSTPNGNWIFSVMDNVKSNSGSITSWSITINYSISSSPVAVTWSPIIDLYTDAGASSPYAGQSLATVYTKPSGGNVTYTATSTNAANCSVTKTVAIKVNPTPVVSIAADYCPTGPGTAGKVKLTATSTVLPVTWLWSTGETTQSILVDIADDYDVTATAGTGCQGKASIGVATELVVNGDFSQGNTGFTSDYNYVPTPYVNGNPATGLWPEKTYNVYPNANPYTHTLFFGKDHTTGSGNAPDNFMIVNGYGNTAVIWEQTVNVSPNTDYYFSAWAMNLNNYGPFARLQFEVNGVPVGTIADLATAPKPASQSDVSLSNWMRFYSNPTWNSKGATTAKIRIINLEPALGGNDFGLDDISFGTLSTFITGPDIYKADNQSICVGTPITPINYEIGSGGYPAIQNMPPGLITTFNGRRLSFTGSPTVAGTYNYTISTTGICNIASVTGTIIVKPDAVINVITPAAQSQIVCVNTPITPIKFGISGGGTGASFTNIPPGLSAQYNAGVVTISGVPSSAGTYSFMVNSTGTCNQASLGGTIVINPASVGGTVNSPTICIGDVGVLTLSGNVGVVDHWEFSNDNWTTFSVINNTANTQSFPPITQSTYYRAVIKNTGTGCQLATSTGGKIRITNYWEGSYSSDWSDGQNWSAGSTPSAFCPNVVIPKVMAGNNYPVVSAGIAKVVNDLIIQTGAQLTLTGGIMQIPGAITNSGTFDARAGTIEFNGLSPQSISGSIFVKNIINNLKISNATKNLTLTGSSTDTLNITGSVSFGVNTATLVTNDHLTLKSSATNTASDLTNGDGFSGNKISGNVIVERYIPKRKAWRFLSIPTQPGQTIQNAWQEGQPANIDGVKGRGIQITANVAPSGANGLDMQSASPSMKWYDPNSDTYVGVTNTKANFDPAKGGYLTFIRGDRSANGINSAESETTLRTKGALNNGLPFSIQVVANKFMPVNNPYAAPIDLNKLGQSDPYNLFFYVYDPNLGINSAYGYGAFQTLAWDGTSYKPTPGQGSYIAPFNAAPNLIQSGQAFWVSSKTVSKTIALNETAKANMNTGMGMLFRAQGPESKYAELRTNLYGINAEGTPFLADGTLIQYADDYSNAIDGMDANKLVNTSENLSVVSGGKDLVIERRQPIIASDTVFYNLTNVRAQPYRYEFIASNLSANGLQGFIEDNYLQTKTPLNMEGITIVNFIIENIPGSYAANRFRIVFREAAGALPVTITSVKAYQKNADIAVEWKVENESNMALYEVEKSVDGNQFSKAATVTAKNGAVHNYSWLDKNAVTGYNYYRIRGVDLNGKVSYTEIVKVFMGKMVSEITIYPNPVTNGKINLQLTNQPEGIYRIRLLNPLGQVIVSKTVTHAEGSSSQSIPWDYNLAHGVYQLEVTKPDGDVKVIKVMY